MFQNKASSPPWRKQSDKVLWRQLSSLELFAFDQYSFERFLSIYRYKVFFFSSLKLQYCRAIVLLNKIKLFKETSFWKATMVLHDFPPRKDGILHPLSGCLGASLPLPQSLYGRTDGRMDGRTLTLQPKFFGSIGYQICLAMELRWRALPAGSLLT